MDSDSLVVLVCPIFVDFGEEGKPGYPDKILGSTGGIKTFTSTQFNKISEKTYSEEQHLVNSRYELLTTRQQFCGDISTLSALTMTLK